MDHYYHEHMYNKLIIYITFELQGIPLISVHLNIGFHDYTGRKPYSFSADRNILVESL